MYSYFMHSEFMNCSFCGSELKPFFISPSFERDISNRSIQKLYQKTQEALKQSKVIHFGGYSFPDADVDFKTILKNAELSNAFDEIYIYNKPTDYKNTPEEISRRQEEERRYKRLFKNPENVHYTDKSFEDFIETI